MLAWIPFLPFIGFLINGCLYLSQIARGKKPTSAPITGTLASLAIFGSFIISLTLFIRMMGMEPAERSFDQIVYSWIQAGELNLDLAFHLDVLSALFCLVITGVGTLIHIYSIGYMSHDPAPGKFFAYLNLFCFAMLILVLGSSLPVMFLGWEGVGLCSYLLIGFWYSDMDKAKAGKKAFVVNRVGDLGFLLGMFLLFTTFGTLEFSGIQSMVSTAASYGDLNVGIVTTICLLLFVGCMGKSAQIPLYVWLPDAMAGPTPVSALIHAATMVTSGIYLVARSHFLFSQSPFAMSVVAGVGAFTAFFAATMAITQTDIKKVLAYSTVSQLGYMFLACGVGAYSAGVFHVITHAFFKALLFLGAGSVIHGMHEEQDIMKMGGLRKKMPHTFMVFLIAWLAICGIPPFAGFFSKDEILWLTFAGEHGSKALWAIGAATAVMTAFYMTRLFYLTFLGEARTEEAKHAHESPFVMTVPLMVLALLSLAGGWIGIPHMNWLAHWLDPIIPHEHALAPGITPSMEWVMMGLSVAGAVVGIVFAFQLYKDCDRARAWKDRFPAIHRVLFNKWYVDELFEALFVRPILKISNFTWKIIDVSFIDRIVVGFGRISAWTGQTARVAQTGSIQTYAVVLVIGIVLTMGFLLYGLV